ncbi:MAG: hypothetical protein QOE28_1937 [Solirubrobacteraceae bacterium]|nr:hypothetical protein [Solirubrobacteraceae bacterium]
MPARFLTVDERPAIRFERPIAHTVEQVWAAVSEPEELVHWFPAAVTVDELRPGAELTFTFPDGAAPPGSGEVLEVVAPVVFAFTWGDELLRLDLEPQEGATLLRFTQVLADRETAARTAAGWEVCLAALTRALDGHPGAAPPAEATADWRAAYDAYVAAGMPAGAPIPEGP